VLFVIFIAGGGAIKDETQKRGQQSRVLSLSIR